MFRRLRDERTRRKSERAAREAEEQERRKNLAARIAAEQKKRKAEDARLRKERKREADRKEKERQRTARKSLKPGPYSVLLTGAKGDYESVRIVNTISHLGYSGEASRSLLDRAVHLEPQLLVADVSEDEAISLKKRLELYGARVKITRTATSARKPGGREPIPERVRSEVWRRDEGRCVDCGSRERLELDHIIPLSKGGSNTARNLELRCEVCNRKKAARI